MPFYGNLIKQINSTQEPVVYFTEDISPESLVRIYNTVLDHKLSDKVAVKISTGEPGGHNFLSPKLIKDLVNEVHGTIVECNTAYEGGRNTIEAHMKAIKDHGFADIAPCDLMDSEGEFYIPINKGLQIKYNIVGSHLKNYNSMIILSHFKGHMMAGFGGALKNMSIGIASPRGKVNIHTAGKDNGKLLDLSKETKQELFLEAMADADSSIINYMGAKNIVYINVTNKLSIDCDCSNNPKEPEMDDIGIFASLDPVALDQACLDAVYNSEDPGKASLIKRIEERKGPHILEAAEKLGLGKRKYRIVTI